MRVVYSRELPALKKGETYQNPRHFTGPLEGAKSVQLLGDYPHIARAYAAAGVSVEATPLDQESAAPPTFAMGLAQRQDPQAPIPDDWRDLPWTAGQEGGLTIRSLANQFSATPIIDKAQAVEAIEAELDRRAR